MFTRTRTRFLFAPDDGSGAGSNPPPANDGDPPEDPPKANDGAENDAEGSGGDEPRFTQAQVDALIDKRIGRERSKLERDLKAMAERDGMDEAERLKAEKVDAEKAAADARREVLVERVTTRAARSALTAGVKADRVDRFMRLVDLSDLEALTADGKPDDDAITKAVADTLADVPEFAAKASQPPTGGADFDGSSGSGKQWTRAEIEKLTPAEFEKHEAEITEQMRAGSIS